MLEKTNEPNGGQKSSVDQAIEDLKKEGFDFPDRPDGAIAPPEDKKEETKESPVVPLIDKKEISSKEPTRDSRKPRVMPRWQHEIELKKSEQEIRAEYEKNKREDSLKNPPSNSTNEDVKTSREWLISNYPDLTDEVIEHFSRVMNGNRPSSELEKRLEALESMNKELLSSHEKNLDKIEQDEFTKEWDQAVAPLVKERYPDLTDGQIVEIKDKLQELGYSDNYLKVSLAKVFRAEEDDIMKSISPRKKSAEGGRGGTARTETLDFEKVTDDDIAKMDEKTFDAFMEFKKKSEKRRSG